MLLSHFLNQRPKTMSKSTKRQKSNPKSNEWRLDALDIFSEEHPNNQQLSWLEFDDIQLLGTSAPGDPHINIL